MEANKSKSKSRSWPWRKKSTQTPSPPNYSSQKQEEQQEKETASSGSGSDNGPRKPNYERRSLSLSEGLLNKNLVQQHAKVAEEAVSGWQKAEADCTRYRKQLEEALEEKADAEDRLYKCMRELDDQNALMESKAAQLQVVEQRLLASEAQNSALLRSVADTTQGKNKAESEVHTLYIKMTGLFKENSRLKYELHLLNKEQHIRRDDLKGYPRKSKHQKQLVTRKNDLGMGRMSSSAVHDLSKEEKRQVVGQEKFASAAALELLRSATCDIQVVEPCNNNEAEAPDDDEVSCAQSWASAMIAELDHFRKDKALMLHDPSKSMDLGFSNISMEANNTTASGFGISITEIVKLVKALAHPLLYSFTKIKRNKSFSDHNTSTELSESDLQLHIEKLGAIKERAVELGGKVSVPVPVVDFCQELVGVLNRLVKIALYRNAQKDGYYCSDNEYEYDHDDDMSGLASVSQHNYEPPNSFMGHQYPFLSSLWNKEEQVHANPPEESTKKSTEESKGRSRLDEKIQRDSKRFENVSCQLNRRNVNPSITPAKCKDAIEEEKRAKKKEVIEDCRKKKSESVEVWDEERSFVQKEVKIKEDVTVYTPRGHGHGHGHPSINNPKHIITTPSNSSSTSKLFDFNSKYIKNAIRSTISKTNPKSNVSSLPTRKSNPPNKLLNRLLSFS
ncbi:hypothetical protein KI387_034994 [Taxus chinensis]|uniref:Uncharacterized protein n=1 Tax=Taxus chinensis TaxID=29808 RepID=A0AA38F7A9_TAXCH|nr:hypothetical protein KI387_034994 [Taxus chinensis]